MMKSVPLHRKKCLLLLALVFGFSSEIFSANSNTDAIIEMVHQESSPASHEFDSIMKKFRELWHNFIHNTLDGKTLSHYIKELKHLSKQIHAVEHTFHEHTTRHAVHNLRKDFDDFISILHTNQASGAKVILLKLKLREDLLPLIPSDVRCAQELVCEAITIRCKK